MTHKESKVKKGSLKKGAVEEDLKEEENLDERCRLNEGSPKFPKIFSPNLLQLFRCNGSFEQCDQITRHPLPTRSLRNRTWRPQRSNEDASRGDDGSSVKW
jgi:hypothetical protein